MTFRNIMFITYLGGKQYNLYLRYDIMVCNVWMWMHRVYNVHMLMRKYN